MVDRLKLFDLILENFAPSKCPEVEYRKKEDPIGSGSLSVSMVRGVKFSCAGESGKTCAGCPLYDRKQK